MAPDTTPVYTEVRQAWGEKGPVGWDLFIDGEWGNRYRLKRDALDAKQKVDRGEV